MTDRRTRALRTKATVDGTRPTASPIFQSAAFQSGSAFFYSRKDNPNVHELEDALAAWEGARHALAVTTGMSALSLLMGLLRPGDTLVCHRLMYGCSLRLFQQQVEERRVELLVLDLDRAEDLARLPASTRLVLFETPTNPFLRTVPIAAVAAAAHRANAQAIVAVDGTWATPLFQQPLHHGADVVVHSLTKFVSGHSDVMGGALLCDHDDRARAAFLPRRQPRSAQRVAAGTQPQDLPAAHAGTRARHARDGRAVTLLSGGGTRGFPPDR